MDVTSRNSRSSRFAIRTLANRAVQHISCTRRHHRPRCHVHEHPMEELRHCLLQACFHQSERCSQGKPRCRSWCAYTQTCLDCFFPFVQPSLKKQIISAELKEILEHSQMAALYHYNDLTVREWDSLRLKLGEKGVKLKIFPSKVSAKILKGTKYHNMASLFTGPSVLAFSESPVLSDLLAMTKSEKKLLLLGGLLENQLFSPKGLEEYTRLPSLEVMHQELVGILSHPQTMLSCLLQGSAGRLSHMLDQISKTDHDGQPHT